MKPILSCDWGTSRFRLRLVERPTRRVVREYTSDQGIQTVAAAQRDPMARRRALGRVLEEGIRELGLDQASGTRVVISGMASSTLGWQSLPYARLPAPMDGSTLRWADFSHAGHPVRLISGLRAESDVMRGEETELIGLFDDPARRALAADCLVVMPGTHSKHVRLRDARIVDFTTHLTGELYGLLCRNSSLDTPDGDEFDAAGFRAGLYAGRAMGLTAALFQARARTVLGLLDPTHTRAFLSGVLIGAEVATLAAAGCPQIVLAAPEPLARPYALALRELQPGIPLLQIPPAELALAAIAGQLRILSY